MSSPQVTIVTGLSGAGRTTAAKVLEDLGFFVIDNLPPQLIERVHELAAVPGSSVDRVALVVDVRGREFFGDLRATLRTLGAREAAPRILFLEAADESLVRRYEAGRRAHPLSGADRIVDGIQRERELLADLRADADMVIDTTNLNVHQLRDRIIAAFARDEDRALAVNVVSFGFKYGTPRDADMVIDVRFLPNPHWQEHLRSLTGLDSRVRDYVLSQPAARDLLTALNQLLDVVVPGFVADSKRYLTIGIGCTGGKHRSVALAEETAAHLRDGGLAVQVHHRDRLRD